MRKLLFSAIVAASTLAVTAPAAAQWTQSFDSQYGRYHGNGYGYNQGDQGRTLMLQLHRLERRINLLDRRNILSEREADRLRFRVDRIENQLRTASYNGLSGNEARAFYTRIARLEQNVRYQANDGNAYANRSDGRYDSGYDRDRDGRDDRYENDHVYGRD